MWNKLGIRARITFGFLPLIVLMAFMSYNAVSGVGGVSNVFTSYRDSAGQSLAITELSRDLHTITTASLSYRVDPQQEYVDRLRTTAARMLEESRALADRTSDPQMAAGLQTVGKDVADYARAFAEVVALRTRQEMLTAKVMDFGPWTNVALAGIMRSAWRQGDLEALHRAAEIAEPLSRSLTAAERFLRLEDSGVYDQAVADLAVAIERMKALQGALTNETQVERAASALGLLQNYGGRLDDARTVMLQRLEIRKNRLDVIGSSLDATFEALQNGVVARQKELGPTAEAMAAATSRSTIVICLVLIALGLVLSYGVGRLISHSVRGMASLMQRIASGDNELTVDGADHAHELGAMARSLRIFQETGRAKLVAEAASEQARVSVEAERQRRDGEKMEDARVMAEAFGELAKGLDALSHGDLTARIGRVDARYAEIAEKFNLSVSTLQSTIGSVVGSISSIRTGLGEITTAANDLSQRTEQQAASLEETVAALGEVTRGMNGTAQGADDACSAATFAQREAEKGGSIVAKAVDAMNEIERSSSEIGKIIGVIDEIAFQTNLLALNAGVEAARAGEAGRGFAVVAQEVRGLAQRSAEAAKEIKALIHTSSLQVEQGVELVSASGRSLEQIVAQVGGVAKVITDMAHSAREQASSLREVSTAADQMDKVTQQNAAMVEETTAAAQTLSSETEELARLVERFRTNIGKTTRTGMAATTSIRPRPAAAASVRQMRTVGSGGAVPKSAAPQEDWEEF